MKIDARNNDDEIEFIPVDYHARIWCSEYIKMMRESADSRLRVEALTQKAMSTEGVHLDVLIGLILSLTDHLGQAVAKNRALDDTNHILGKGVTLLVHETLRKHIDPHPPSL